MKSFAPFSIPLDGITLIEAGAGTGKTWNITRLYLRHLLEDDLEVGRILVVTFTQAATEELRDRIRGRLRLALEVLEGKEEARNEDPEMTAWLVDRAAEHEADRRRLRAALAGFDEAAVYTIHGFCQRVLSEHAFEAGAPFDVRFITDEAPLRRQVMEDFWRHWFAVSRLPRLATVHLLERFPSPEALLRRVGARLSDAPEILPPMPDWDRLRAGLETAQARLERAHSAFRRAWNDEQEEVIRFLRDPKRGGLHAKVYTPRAVDKMIGQARMLAESDDPMLSPDESLERLRLDRLKLRKGYQPPQLVFFERCRDYFQALETFDPLLRDLEAACLHRARAWLAEGLARYKGQESAIHFDDLLILLDRALDGAGGAELTRILRRRYPRALIDEFQDTDRVQYRIFKTLYGMRAPGTGLCLIGDPKQAIYGFRGGDLHTYLEAAGDAEQVYSLETNWRASSGLVRAVNALFEEHSQPFRLPGIHYRPLRPSPKADEDPLMIDGRAPVPMQFWRLRLGERTEGGRRGSAALTMEQAKAQAAEVVARHVRWLLEPGRARLGEAPLAPSQVAVLVRTHADARLIQEALRRVGVASATRAQESVFSTEEARWLRHLLEAVVLCEEGERLRHVLAEPLLGYDAGAIQALLEDERAWEALQQRFFEYRDRWREQGFIQGFQFFFRREGVAARLLARPGGERSLTNLLQLAELLQQEARARPGLKSLVRWLADRMQLADRHEAALLRLESDERLVQVVTVHASKGLEYPVVYVPFPWADGSVRSDPPRFYHDSDGRAVLHLGGGDPEAEARAKALLEEELRAEKLRLFYVAVTRAARLCVLTWGPVNQAEESALAWLLSRDGTARDQAGMEAALESLASASKGTVEVRDPPIDEIGETKGALAAERKRLAPRRLKVAVPRDWRVGSYSAVVAEAEFDRPDHDLLLAGEELPATAGDDPLPAGPAFGRFFHELLEGLDFTHADGEALKARIRRLALRHGLPQLVADAGMRAVTEMVERLLWTPLPEAGLRLCDLPVHRRVDEMGFHFAGGLPDPHRLATVLAPFPAWRAAAERLRHRGFHGLMHGYIDLVFEQGGRYWLADYKTNRLDAYTPEALERAMRAHHYPLQALIYVFALHRHLGQCLPGYAPERHLGGVFYLFARGMDPDSGAGVWHRRITPDLMQALERELEGRI